MDNNNNNENNPTIALIRHASGASQTSRLSIASSIDQGFNRLVNGHDALIDAAKALIPAAFGK